MGTAYTIGHSTHSHAQFVDALRKNEIEVLVDVRSAPYSSYTPHFDREVLKQTLNQAEIKYVFLGSELGGRPGNAAYYDPQGRTVYGRLVSDADFISGIERLERGIAEFRVAIMCGEEDPAHCHRRLLVGRVLIERGHSILHIRSGGELQTEAQLAIECGKELVDAQPALFPELDEDQWRSTVSVLPKKARSTFSTL